MRKTRPVSWWVGRDPVEDQDIGFGAGKGPGGGGGGISAETWPGRKPETSLG